MTIWRLFTVLNIVNVMVASYYAAVDHGALRVISDLFLAFVNACYAVDGIRSWSSE